MFLDKEKKKEKKAISFFRMASKARLGKTQPSGWASCKYCGQPDKR